MCNNLTSRDQIGATLKFVKFAKDTSFKILPFLAVPNITPRYTPETRKLLFCQQEKQKIPFKKFFRKSSIVSKNVSARKSFFSQAEISFGNRGTLRPDETLERTYRGEKSLREVVSTIIPKLHQLHRIKKQQRDHPQDSENIFFYTKPQQPKIANTMLRKQFSGKIYK